MKQLWFTGLLFLSPVVLFIGVQMMFGYDPINAYGGLPPPMKNKVKFSSARMLLSKSLVSVASDPTPVSTEVKCNATSNFVFIKTHKTGSSTLRSLTCRYGYFRNLSFVLGAGGVIGHLNGISIKIRKDWINLLPPIGVATGDYVHYRNYNISNIHLIYNEQTLKKIMYPADNLKYFTIIREPSQQWISFFTYFRWYKKAGLKYDNLSEAILPYLKELPLKKGSTFNRQLRDLGVGSAIIHGSPEALNETIKRLDKKLALVLITEYFDESLLLMKRMFCWNFTDILYVKKRQQPKQVVVDADTRKEILRHNAPDVALYNYFLEVFWRRVKEYGPTFQDDLNKFRKLLNDTWDKCIGKAVAQKSPDRYIYIENFLAANSSTFCWALVNSKFSMDVEIVRRQGRLSDKRWKTFE